MCSSRSGAKLAPPRPPHYFVQVSEYYTQKTSIRETFSTRVRTDTRLCLDVGKAHGAGRVDIHKFRDGLTLSVADYCLRAALEDSYALMGPQFGFSLMLRGRFELTAPALGLRDQVAGGQTWLRAGDLGVLHGRSAALERMRGLSIDVPTDMVDTWREDGPRAFNRAIGGILAGHGPVCTRLDGTDDRLWTVAETLHGANMNTPCGRLRAESLALDLLARLLAPDTPPRDCFCRRKQAALDEAMDILRAEWTDPPTIARLARRIGLNECYLKAGFRERFGMTIAGYVRTLRMVEARRLIEQEGHSVQQAALSVGFSNPSHFSAAFRRIHGCNPSRVAAAYTIE